MPVAVTYPGVYIEEVPSGVRTITGVSTAVAAFIDGFKQGPVNRPVQIFNPGDFEREFGGLDARSEASYAIQQFFLNGGTEAWVVRVVTSGAAAADVAHKANLQIRPDTAAASALLVEALNEGAWGNRIGVRVNGDAPVAGEFNMTITLYGTSGGRDTPIRQEVFRNLSMTAAAPNNVDRILSDAVAGSKLVKTTATVGASAPLVNGTLSGTIAEPIALGGAPTLNVSIGGSLPMPLVLAATSTTRAAVAADLQEKIRAASPADRAFAGATVEILGQRLLVRAPGTPSATIVFTENGGTTAATLRLLVVAGPTLATANVQEYRLGVAAIAGTAVAGGQVGQDGIRPSSTALIGSLAAKTGIYALEDVDLFNILCIPRAAMVKSVATEDYLSWDQGRTVINVAQAYCESRRAFFVVDTPLDHDEPAEIKAWMSGGASVRHKNAALYYPRVMVADPLDSGRLRSFGASGTVAGLFARTDAARGVWKAPAGTEASLRNVARVEDVLTDAENGTLNPLGINCLRNFPVYGPVCWGARTLDGADQQASEWKYVPVRRLALFLEESLFRGTKSVVFEPNDEPLWAQIRLNLGAFMQTLFRQGAFQGTTPKEAYFVKCDRETTTQTDINSGIVNIVVGFAPLKPAEFVIIKIQQMAGQIAT